VVYIGDINFAVKSPFGTINSQEQKLGAGFELGADLDFELGAGFERYWNCCRPAGNQKGREGVEWVHFPEWVHRVVMWLHTGLYRIKGCVRNDVSVLTNYLCTIYCTGTGTEVQSTTGSLPRPNPVILQYNTAHVILR